VIKKRTATAMLSNDSKNHPLDKKKEKKRKEDLKVYLLNYRYYSEKKEGSISTPQP
jgi:hypothetical protein